jgi:serine/threonine-protein kinase
MSPQESIAHYRITAKLGEGGMGAVYRATDTKLNRDVAIKILPETFAADPDRLARFTREAQVLASLNHPNIAAIYGVEERALILELVEGATLAERIAAGPIPLDEALPIARQIAEALEYAHDRGIIHRDLKPANVKVTSEGRVKVLDFGLAKALAADLAAGDPASSPTLTMRATMAGMIMGTAGYMAPEQAKGKPVDRRADIWAFGVLLVEMLTATMMYTGETVSETLASVIKDQPNLSKLPAETPPAVRRLIKRCLDKDPQRRLQAIGEARIAIDDAPAEEAAATQPSAAPSRRGAPWWALALAAVIPTAVAVAFLWRTTRPLDRPLQRFSVDLGPDATLGVQLTAAISPDGKRIVYPVRSNRGTLLATRLLEQSKPTILAGTEGGFDAFFKPDSQWIGYSVPGRLMKISVQGGAAVLVCEGSALRGAFWGDDGYIYIARDTSRVSRVPEAGGSPEVLTDPQKRGVLSDRWPQLLPGGEALLMTTGNRAGAWDDGEITVYSFKTKRYKVVQRGGYYGRYLPSGHLVYVHQGTLFAVSFDLSRLETRGAPIPVLDDVAGDTSLGYAQLSFSNDGAMVYLPGNSGADSVPVLWIDHTGQKQPLLANPGGRPQTPRVSPDGKLLALAVNGNLSVYDPARGLATRLTFPPDTGIYPIWMPDAKHIIFTGQGGSGIYWARSDGSGKPEKIYEGNTAIAQSVSPDGKVLALHQAGQARDLYTMPLDLTDPDHAKAGKPTPFLITPGADVDPAFSPDGRWLVYASSESGTFHVFVRPFPEGANGAGQAQISSTPGRFPLWSRTKKEIYYVTLDGHIMMTPYVINGRAFAPGRPELWSQATIGLTGVGIPWDIAPDGKRFVVFPGVEMAGGEKANLHATFLLNFFDELRRKLP